MERKRKQYAIKRMRLILIETCRFPFFFFYFSFGVHGGWLLVLTRKIISGHPRTGPSTSSSGSPRRGFL
jgi:hypothetical protein